MTLTHLSNVSWRLFRTLQGMVKDTGHHHLQLFLQCFLTFQNHISFFWSDLICSLQMFSIWISLKICPLVMSKNLTSQKILSFINSFPNKPCFLRVCSTSLLKTLREKEKLLVTSNFSFSHSVFYRLRELCVIFIKFEIVVCKLFQFGKV